MTVDYVWLPALMNGNHICNGCAFEGDVRGCVNVDNDGSGIPSCSRPNVVAVPKDGVDMWAIRRTLDRLGVQTKDAL